MVLAHHLAPGWNGDRGWTLQRTVRSGRPAELGSADDLRSARRVDCQLSDKVLDADLFDNPENLTLELSSKGLQITRNGVSKTVACEIRGEYEVVFFVAGDFHPVNLDFEITELTAVGTPGQKEPQIGVSGYLASVNIVNTLKDMPPVEEYDPAKAVKTTLDELICSE